MRKMMIMFALVVSVLAGACAPASTLVVDVEEGSGADPAMVASLLNAGYRGIAGDGREAIYVPVWTVVDVAGGTWTATPDGMAKCEDGTTGECTGREFLPGA